MKKTLFTACFILSTFFNYAQSYQWITGGGSSTDLSPYPGYEWEGTTNAITDAHGNLYIASPVGSSNIKADTFDVFATNNTTPGAEHYLLASYSCDGTMRWAKIFESSSNGTWFGADFTSSNSTVAYSNGSIYVAGTFGGGNYEYIDYDTTIFLNYPLSFTAKFDTSGKFKWIRFVGPDSSYVQTLADEPGILAVDGQGYIHNFDAIRAGLHLTPTYITATTGTYDLKYDSTGNLMSVARVQLDSVWIIAKAIFSGSGKYYALMEPSSSYWTLTNYNYAIAAFLPTETMLWWDTTGAAGYMNSFDYKGGNEIYACGIGQPNPLAPHPDTFSFGGITITDTIVPRYPFESIIELDTNGVAHWVYNLSDNISGDDITDISILPGGAQIAATGVFGGKLIHHTDTIISTSAGGNYNPFLVIVDNSGNTVELNQINEDNSYGTPTYIASDAIGDIYIGGQLTDSVYPAGLRAYQSNGGNTDFFVCKYGYSNCDSTGTLGTTSTAVVSKEEGAIRLYPNPATDELNVTGIRQATNYQLLTVTGVAVQQGVMQPGENMIQMHNCVAGMYILEMNGADGTGNVVRVVKE